MAGAAADSSPGAEEGNLPLQVLHHTEAGLLLEKERVSKNKRNIEHCLYLDARYKTARMAVHLDTVAVVLAEVAVALQDPSPSSGFQLLRLPSPRH